MKRLKKFILLIVRRMAFKLDRQKLYYWADMKLDALWKIDVMPTFYYRWLFKLSMKLVEKRRFRRLADRAIHTIPYHVRFYVA